MTMIEKVARALCVADGKSPDADWRDSGAIMLAVADPTPENWRRYVGKARAAIEAMREPTQGMLDAACWQPSQAVISLYYRWRAMIDAALSEGPTP